MPIISPHNAGTPLTLWPPGPSPTSQAHYVAAALPQLPCTTRHTIRHSSAGLSYTQKPHISYYHTRTYAKHNIMNPPFLLTFTSYRARTLSSMPGGCTVCLNLAIVTQCFTVGCTTNVYPHVRLHNTVRIYGEAMSLPLYQLCCHINGLICVSMLCTVHVHRYFYQ